jgi:hypothetical protein
LLSRIVKEFREAGGTINLSELSRRLGVEPSALDSMLEVLVRQGKLCRIGEMGIPGGCNCSGSCHGCGHYHLDGNMVKVYELAVPALLDKDAI